MLPPLAIDLLPWIVSGAVAVTVCIVFAVVLDRRFRRARETLEEELREAGRAVAHDHTVLDAALEALDPGVVVVDGEGRLLVLNGTARRMVGDVPGATDLASWVAGFAAFAADGHTPFDLGELVRTAMVGVNPESVEVTLGGNGSGAGVRVMAVARTMRDAEGEVVGALLAMRPIEEVSARQVDLEARLEELERTNEELGRFTYTVSHELRSPLVTIAGFLRLLRRDLEQGDPDRLALDVTQIEEAVESMGQLLEDLLELSRSGVVIDAAGTVDLGAVVHDVLRSLDDRIRRARAEVVVSESLPTVRGDGRRLKEVYLNLVENALKFLGAQPAPRIEIGARGEGAARVFYVRDNGVGIPEEHRDRVFRIFERLDASVEGTGVGLALVKGIIEAHHGRVWIESGQGGVGSTFCFTLPNGFNGE